MAVKESTTVRNAKLDAIETAIGTSPKFRIYSGSIPANCAASRTGTLLVEMALPSDWAANASSGAKALAGTWSGTAAADGTAGYWSIMDNAGTTCHMQGTITGSGGGGDVELSTTTIVTGGLVSVTAFTMNEGNS